MTPGQTGPGPRRRGRRFCRRRLLNALILAFLPLACRVPARSSAPSSTKVVTVVFRFDDYRRTDSRVGTELLALFQKHRIPCTYGVIPYSRGGLSMDSASYVPIDRETAGKLDDAVRSGLVEVAQHGFAHHWVPDRGEFIGLDYATELQLLSAGRRTLQSLYQVGVTTFIPPWNAYDANTLRALDSLGFRVISASDHRDGVSGRWQEIEFLPYTSDLGGLREAVGYARKTSDSAPVVVVMLHPYDFVGSGDKPGRFTYQHLDGLLAWLAAQSDVATQTLGDAAKSRSDMNHSRYLQFVALADCQRWVPGFFRARWYKASFYPSTRLARSMIAFGWGRVILFYLLMTAVAAILVGLAANLALSRMKLVSTLRIVRYSILGLLALYIIYTTAAMGHPVAGRHMMVLAGLLGACLGVWGAAAIARRTRPREATVSAS